MKLRKVMSEGIETVLPGDPLIEAARRMRALDVGALPVQEPEGELVGIVTDRDIAVRAVAEGMDPNGSTVSQIMTPQVQTCSANRDIADAARLMETRRIRRLVVVDASGAPVGMISLGDLALHAPGAKLPVSALKGVSKPKAPD